MKGTIVGTVSQIGEIQEFGENAFKKQEVIFKTVEEFPNVYCVEFTQKNIELVNDLEVGKNYKATVNLKGREHINDKEEYNVFHSVNCWRIEPLNV